MGKRKRLCACLLALMALLALGIGLLSMVPTIVVLRKERDHTRIQEAIDAAEDHARILVRTGRYQENLIIDKPLAIYGEAGVALRPADPTLAAVSAPGAGPVLIHGLRIEAATVGIELERFAGAVPISSCSIAASGIGVVVTMFQAGAAILHSVVFDGETGGIGVRALGTGSTILAQCAFSGLATGIVIGSAATVLMADCVLEGDFDAISTMDTATVKLVNNNIHRNHGNGIRITRNPFPADLQGVVMLIGNRIEHNGSWGVTLCGMNGSAPATGLDRIMGIGNVFEGNREGATCPEELGLDWRRLTGSEEHQP